MVDKDAYVFLGFLVFEQIFIFCQFLSGANSEFASPIYMVHFFFLFFSFQEYLEYILAQSSTTCIFSL